MNGKPDEHSDLDSYVSKQLEQYYGKDVVQQVSRTSPPALPEKRPRRGFTIAAVLCSAVFLTGAFLLAGVLFSGGIPTSGNIDSSSADSQQAVSSETHSETRHSQSSQFESSSESSSISEISSVYSDNSVLSKIEASSSRAASAFVSSAITESGDDSKLSSWRIESYSLPDIPDESGYIIESDDNNNSITNPYDSVKTGRNARAGIGVFLMAASLGCSVALYNSYTDKEY